MTRNRQWSDLGSDKNGRSPGLTTTPLFITAAAPWGRWPLEWIPCVQESTTQRASEPAGVISAEPRMGEAGGGGGGGGGGVSRRGGGSSSEAAVSDPTLGRGWRWALPLSHSWEPTKISGSEVSWYLKEGEDGDICGEVKVKFPLRRAIYSRVTNYTKWEKLIANWKKSEHLLLLFRIPWWGGCGNVKVKPTSSWLENMIMAGV